MKFYSPYQFIPVDTSKTSTLKWREHGDLAKPENQTVRHDYWHKDGWSGRINCKLTCRTPLVIGARQIQGSRQVPGKVEPYRHPDGALAIPGNSLRGMISSIVECISQSAMRVLASEEETCYSQRKRPQDSLKKLGILRKKDNQYSIYPLNSEHYYNVSQGERMLSDGEGSYQHKQSKSFVYATLDEGQAKDLVKNDSQGKESGILYVRGNNEKMPRNRKSERFIRWDGNVSENAWLAVDTGIVQLLEKILRDRYADDDEFPQLPKGYARDLHDANSSIAADGDLLYYGQDRSGKVNELSYSSIWRTPVKGNLHKAFIHSGGKNSLPWGPDRTGLTPAERLLGVVEENPADHSPGRQLASRVRFMDAKPSGEVELGAEITLKILDSPKPPSPAMYFSGASGHYIPKRQLDLDKHKPNGRKVYIPKKDLAPTWKTSINDNNHNWKPHLKVTPIAQNTEFTFNIYFENLGPEELNLLYTSLRPAPDFVHRLGLGKPLGLGQVSLSVESLERIERNSRYTPNGLAQSRYSPSGWPVPTESDSLIDSNSLALVATLGDPNVLSDAHVCYPFTEQQGPNSEEEGFEWFVANEKLQDHNEYLRIADAGSGDQIPLLKDLRQRR